MVRSFLSIVVLISFAVPAWADDWSGQSVTVKETVKLGSKFGGGLVREGAELKPGTPYRVKSDDGTYLELEGGFIFKSEAALAKSDKPIPRSKTRESDPASAKGEWFGKLVVGKKQASEITFGDFIDGKQVYFKFDGHYPQRVREDKDGWLRLFDGHKEGWARKDEFMLSQDALSYFTSRINANEKDVFAWGMRGLAWIDRSEHDNAIKDFTECIRLDPKYALAFHNRGIAWYTKGDKDRAIKDYDEAIRLDSKYASAFYNRGYAWYTKGDSDRAIKDYDEAIRLDPKYDLAFINRGTAWSAKGDNDRAIKDYDEAIRLDPKDAYAMLLGHFAARAKGDKPTAKRFLTNSAAKLDKAAWPYPVLKYLRGEIDEPALLKLAIDNDKRTEARCYLGLDHLLKGQKREAIAHFRWVQEHGNRSFVEYSIALKELNRLAATGDK